MQTSFWMLFTENMEFATNDGFQSQGGFGYLHDIEKDNQIYSIITSVICEVFKLVSPACARSIVR